MSLNGSVLVVGAGGLGSPAALVLARSGVAALTVVDDDVVDESNLQRQILYGSEDAGRDKGEVAAERLAAEAEAAGHTLAVRVVRGRLLPTTALDLMAGHDVVLEGADNFATKFLTVDAAGIAGVPCVQAGVVRWAGWAMASLPSRAPCLRCVFEDIPRGRVETCAEAGVVGPVVGVLGALEAALTLRLLLGDESVAGELYSYDGLAGRLRRTSVQGREACPRCAGEIRDLPMSRYVASCAA